MSEKTLTRAQRMPKRIRRIGAGGAWWYEDEQGISLHFETPDGRQVLSGSIGWAGLLRAAQRSSGREVIVKDRRR